MREPLIYVPAWIWIIFVAAAAVSVFSLFCAARRERLARLRAAIPQNELFTVSSLVLRGASPRSARRTVVRLCESGHLVWIPIEDRTDNDTYNGTPKMSEVDSFEYRVVRPLAPVST
jgi:hypothetical protein